MHYVYRWEGTGKHRAKKLFAVFMHEENAMWFVLLTRRFCGLSIGIDNPMFGIYWISPYGPTLHGNQDVTPAGSVNPVLEK
jgi:hypothetical protein